MTLTPAAIVDIVMLASTTDRHSACVTHTAIQTAIDNVHPHQTLNVIVVEQNPTVTHPDADLTVHRSGPFNFNAAANFGARLGCAPNILVANNDLVFGPDWLTPLLEARHPIVSARCPVDIRQRDFTVNTKGGRVGHHLSGWCYMMSRAFYTKIGGLDEEFTFWCADDVVVEQCRQAGILPMIVPASEVTHLGSYTLNTHPDFDDLTWAQVDRFIARFGRHRCMRDPRYLAWRARQRGQRLQRSR